MSVAALQQDFETLARCQSTVVAVWAGRHPVLAGCHDLCDVLAAVPTNADGVLAALLLEVAEGCPVAPRVVLQAMLPKMIRMAGKDAAASLADYLAHLWLRIASYPLARRPERIAANLALDTLKAVKADQASRAIPVADFDDRARAEPTDEFTARRLLRAAVDLRLIDPTLHATMLSVYAEGLSEPAAAARHRVTPTTLRRRCNRGIKQMAAYASQLAEAM